MKRHTPSKKPSSNSMATMMKGAPKMTAMSAADKAKHKHPKGHKAKG